MGNTRARISLLLPSLLAATLCFTTQVSRAEDAPVSDSPQAERTQRPWSAALDAEFDRERPPADPDTRARSYTPELAGAYVAVPFLAACATFGLAALNTDVGFEQLVLGIVISGAAPAIVHFLNDRPGRGLVSWLAVPATFFGAGFLVTLVSLGILNATEDTDDSSDEGGFARGLYALVAGFVGGALATTAWAIYDVIATQRLAEGSKVRVSHASLRFSIMPTPVGVTAVLGARF
jgi:hypothetical protein